MLCLLLAIAGSAFAKDNWTYYGNNSKGDSFYANLADITKTKDPSDKQTIYLVWAGTRPFAKQYVDNAIYVGLKNNPKVYNIFGVIEFNEDGSVKDYFSVKEIKWIPIKSGSAMEDLYELIVKHK